MAAAWTPDPNPSHNAPPVAPYPFPGRSKIEAWKESAGSSPPERLTHILAALDAGHIDAPTWRRIKVRGGLEVEASSDGVTLGLVRLCGPMAAAQYIADHFDALICTAGIVDAIYAARDATAAPQTLGWQEGGKWRNPGGSLPWWMYYADRLAAKLPPTPGAVLSPIGKDYVLDARQPEHPDRCAIYGWQNVSGVAIQSPATGASFIHELSFFDYSHTIRIVRRRAWLNGAEVDLASIYQNQPRLVSYKALPTGPIPTRHPDIPPRKSPDAASFFGSGGSPVPGATVPAGFTTTTAPAGGKKKSNAGRVVGAVPLAAAGPASVNTEAQ